ncbi:hypothetical protein ACMATS_13805 [Streptoverticillium reticulum]|uniref:hypothetical protein n=1 Tax=Streptoverticillium reticulum TaxID=1433415 RepID=UPI0039BEDAF1
MKHAISTHPRSEITVTAHCMSGGCGWTLAPTADLETADVAMMSHTGRSGHPLFGRTFEDVALVRRLELNEGKREIPALPSEEPQHEHAAH